MPWTRFPGEDLNLFWCPKRIRNPNYYVVSFSLGLPQSLKIHVVVTKLYQPLIDIIGNFICSFKFLSAALVLLWNFNVPIKNKKRRKIESICMTKEWTGVWNLNSLLSENFVLCYIHIILELQILNAKLPFLQLL